MKKLLARAPFTKDKIARRELAFAHTIIVLLSVSLLAVLGASQNHVLSFDPNLTFIVCILLLVVIFISAAIVASLLTRKK